MAAAWPAGRWHFGSRVGVLQLGAVQLIVKGSLKLEFHGKPVSEALPSVECLANTVTPLLLEPSPVC